MKNRNSVEEFRAAKSSNREQKIKIFNQCREMYFVPNAFATALLTDSKPDWIPLSLFFEMTDSLRGFDEDMSLIIADDLIDCWNGHGMHVTGYRHIDDLLGNFYARILMCAFKEGINLM